MTSFIVKRILYLIPTFFLATFLAWMIIDIAPGDFASQFAFDQVDPEKEQRIREVLGLDQPGIVRYFYWLRNLVFNFDLGTSMVSKDDVTALVYPRMMNSLRLTLIAVIITYLIAIPIGIFSAVRKYTLGDRVLTVFSLVFQAIPNFFLGLIVLALAVEYFQASGGRLLIPTGGMTSNGYAQLGPLEQLWDSAWHLIAPVLVVALSSLAGLTRIMRGQMLEVLGQDYVRTARAKGLPQGRVTYKHAARNAILPIIALIGGTLPGLVAGAGTVEYVLRWPGLTPFFIRSVIAQDVYAVMAIITVITALVMVGNIISDILLATVDPRIRY